MLSRRQLDPNRSNCDYVPDWEHSQQWRLAAQYCLLALHHHLRLHHRRHHLHRLQHQHKRPLHVQLLFKEISRNEISKEKKGSLRGTGGASLRGAGGRGAS